MRPQLTVAEQPSKPERCAAENLKPGQFLAAGALTTGRPTEVLFVDTYPLDPGRETLIVHRALGVDWSTSSIAPGNRWFDLAAEADLAEFRAGAERARKIADIRALADWLDDNPDMPMPNFYDANAHLDERHNGGPTTAESYAEVRRIAARLGVDAEERLDDRTTVSKTFGCTTYQVIAWHPDGRPADPKPRCVASLHTPIEGATCYRCGAPGFMFDDADPTGLAYTRADDADDPTPVSGARVEPHVGGVTNEGLVDETPEIRPLDTERYGYPGMVTCTYCLGRVMDTDWLAHARTHDPQYSVVPDAD